MDLKLRRHVLCFALTLLAYCGPTLLAADADHALIERLEAADTPRQQQDILNEIATRTAEGPLAVELTDRLIAELMSNDLYGYHHIMSSLPRLAGERGYSDQSLITLAEGLSGKLVQQYTPAESIAKTLSAVHSTSGLPESAFSALLAALDHIGMLNRSAAIEVLAVTRAENARFAAAMQAIVAALMNSDHQHTRSSAIAGLKTLISDQPIPPDVLGTLAKTAMTDPYVTVRMDALELLAVQALDEALRDELSASLATEIITPTPELWGRSSGLRQHDTLNDRAVAVLGVLHVPPYPEHVIDAWIALTRTYEPDKSLQALRPVYERNELTAAQVEDLVHIAKRHRRASEREKVYAMLFVELQAGTLMDALIAFESAEHEEDRIRAGYALEQQYSSQEVPARVADVAARVSVAGSSAERRAIAAGLLSRTLHNGEKRENQLIAALERHPDEGDIHLAIVDLYGPERIEDLVIAYASDPQVSVSFRRHIVGELGKQPDPTVGLSPGAENTLKDVARNADDYYLVQNAGDTLKAWGVRPPLRVMLKNRNVQSMTLFVILVGLVIVNLIAAIVTLISLLKLRLKTDDHGKRVAIRVSMIIVFVAVSVGMLVLLVAGAIGFLGHNSAPSPKATLLWNLPAYGGTLIYVFLSWLLWRRAGAGKLLNRAV